jgi:hypothetical protein
VPQVVSHPITFYIYETEKHDKLCIKVYYSPTNAEVIVLKTILKLTLKQLRHVSVQSHHQQGAHNVLPDDGVTAPKHVGAVFMSILM